MGFGSGSCRCARVDAGPEGNGPLLEDRRPQAARRVDDLVEKDSSLLVVPGSPAEVKHLCVLTLGEQVQGRRLLRTGLLDRLETEALRVVEAAEHRGQHRQCGRYRPKTR